MSLEYNEENHIWYRSETTDLRIVQGQKIYEELFSREVDTVLDAGAHIGAFARFAASHTKKIICVEPEADNFLLLLRNTIDIGSAVLIRAAVTDNKKLLRAGSGAFRVSKSYNQAVHCLGTSSEMVPVISFRKLISIYEPQVIKIDIEREERGLNFCNLPSSIISIAIEYHPVSFGRNIHEILLKQGFTSVRLLDFSKGCNDVGIYRRIENAL